MPKKSYTLVTLRNVDNPNDWWTPVYCAEIDQKRELVHFGKLTPPLAGRIPEMQMPMFKSATNDEIWKKNQKKIRPFFLHPFGKFGRSDLIFRICPGVCQIAICTHRKNGKRNKGESLVILYASTLPGFGAVALL